MNHECLEAERQAIEKEYMQMLRIEYEKRAELENKLIIARKEIERLSVELEEEKKSHGSLLNRSRKSERTSIPAKKLVRKVTQRLKAQKALKKGLQYWSPVFDARYYRDSYPDLVEAVANSEGALLEHFVLHGINEGRVANDQFNIHTYLNYNPDVKKLCQSSYLPGYIHYLQYGMNEHRRAN